MYFEGYLATSFAILGTVLFLTFKWRLRHVLAAANKLPCPPALPILGNSLLLLRSIKTNDIMQLMVRMGNQFKDVFCVWIGIYPVFVVTNPDDVQIVFNSSSTLDKSDLTKLLRPLLGNGLLTSPVPIWKKYRRLLTPIFHPVQVEKYLDIFNKVSRQLTQRFVDNPVIDPRDDIFNTSIDAALMTIMGKTVLKSYQIKDKIRFLLKSVGDIIMARLTQIWLQIEWVYKIIYRKELKQIMAATNFCKQFCDNFLKENEEERRLKKINVGQHDEVEHNFTYLAYNHPEDETENHTWYDEIATVIVAASDTTVSALSFFLLTVANYPKVQTKIREEIRDVMGDSNRDVTTKDIESLTYLHQVLMESMRLHGVSPIILRKATKDTKLRNATLPAGCTIVLLLQAMGWNTDYFPEPHKFLPDRFAPENMVDRHKYAFVPFAAAPRNCIGKKYALFLMKTEIIHIFRTFEIKTKVRLEDVEYDTNYITESKTPMILEFVPL